MWEMSQLSEEQQLSNYDMLKRNYLGIWSVVQEQTNVSSFCLTINITDNLSQY